MAEKVRHHWPSSYFGSDRVQSNRFRTGFLNYDRALSLTTNQTSISPFPLTASTPPASQTKSPLTRSNVSLAIWIFPLAPCDSMRLAVFTASPHKSYVNFLRPITPATTGPELIP